MSKTPIYLDYAAATPLDPRVRQAMAPYESEQFYNPSARYGAARQAKLALEAARAQVARVLGAKPTEIIFTAGATESINLALLGVLRQYPQSHMLAAATEHESVLACLDAATRAGHTTGLIPVAVTGAIDPAVLRTLIHDDTVIITIAYANSEIGTIQPLSDIAAMIRDIRSDRQQRGIALPLYLHSDASAAAGSLDLHVSRLSVDLLTLNAGKIYGPKQSGALYVRSGLHLEPLVYGGGQERGLRSGTQAIAQAIGLATALELAQNERGSETKRLGTLRDNCLAALKQAVPDIILNGPASRRLASNLNITIPGAEGEDLVLYLDEAGFQVATGSACSASDTEPAHVLQAIGRSRAEASQSLRLSFGRPTTAEQLQSFVTALPAIVARVRELAK